MSADLAREDSIAHFYEMVTLAMATALEQHAELDAMFTRELRDGVGNVVNGITLIENLEPAPWVVAGVLSARVDVVTVRLHMPGRPLPASVDKEDSAQRSMVNRALQRLIPMEVAFQMSEARCLEHDECAEHREVGILCWRSRRGERA